MSSQDEESTSVMHFFLGGQTLRSLCTDIIKEKKFLKKDGSYTMWAELAQREFGRRKVYPYDDGSPERWELNLGTKKALCVIGTTEGEPTLISLEMRMTLVEDGSGLQDDTERANRNPIFKEQPVKLVLDDVENWIQEGTEGAQGSYCYRSSRWTADDFAELDDLPFLRDWLYQDGLGCNEVKLHVEGHWKVSKGLSFRPELEFTWKPAEVDDLGLTLTLPSASLAQFKELFNQFQPFDAGFKGGMEEFQKKLSDAYDGTGLTKTQFVAEFKTADGD